MRDWSRRARVVLAGGVVGVLGAGLAGALVIPASAQASSARPTAAAAAPSIIQVCLTVVPLHIPRTCVGV